MKLKTKLIPLSLVAVIPTATIPVSLTSCGSDTLINKVYDLSKNYYTKFERHEATSLKGKEFHDLYTSAILENPEIFIDDYFWSRSWVGSTFEPLTFWNMLIPGRQPDIPTADKTIIGPSKNTFDVDNQVISNLEVTSQDAIINGESWTYPTLSFTLDINEKVKSSTFAADIGGEFVNGSVEGNITCKLKFTNVPFRLAPRTCASEEQPFSIITASFEPFYEWLDGFDVGTPQTRPMPWRIEISVTSAIFGELNFGTGLVQRISDDYDFNAISDEQNPRWAYGDVLTFENTLCCLFTSSHYLGKISLKE